MPRQQWVGWDLYGAGWDIFNIQRIVRQFAGLRLDCFCKSSHRLRCVIGVCGVKTTTTILITAQLTRIFVALFVAVTGVSRH